ncbi:MAG: hypothetical protein GY714_04520 [Desulfobacterales bacterium]|nr:hypothetical protein [Desulfobacterales bacterium]
MRFLFKALIISCIFIFSLTAKATDYFPPEKIKVRTVFFVPGDETNPTDVQIKSLKRYLKKSQNIWKQMLKGKDTFGISNEKDLIIKGDKPLQYYKNHKEWAAPEITGRFLKETGHNRFNAPYIYLIIMMNSKDHFPKGGGRPLNGGFNTGGGIIMISSFTLMNTSNFMSTLIHELGHSFGLPHVDVYGYDMKNNRSIMSYDIKNRTYYFENSATPAILIPEDLRLIAMNRRVFSIFTYQPGIKSNYKIFPDIIWLGPMKISDQPDYEIGVTTNSGEAFTSRVKNIVTSRIKKSIGPGVTFDARNMWSSGKIKEWGFVELTFPFEVKLDRIKVYSQHSGKYHKIKACIVEVKKNQKYKRIYDKQFKNTDEIMDFQAVTSSIWRLHFKTASHYIVIRGLRFFYKNMEIFPQMVP